MLNAEYNLWTERDGGCCRGGVNRSTQVAGLISVSFGFNSIANAAFGPKYLISQLLRNSINAR